MISLKQVGRVHDGVEVGRILPHLDGAPQIQERFVDLADRAQHVLFEHHREISIGALRFAFVVADVLNIFEADAAPQHGDDHNAENRRAAALGDKLRELREVQFHVRGMLVLLCGILAEAD